MANKGAANITKANEKRTSAEARENGRKGGIASGKARKAKAMKTFKEQLMDDMTPEDIKAMNEALKRYAKRGSLPHYQFLLKMLGQDPDADMVDKTITVEITGGEDYCG